MKTLFCLGGALLFLIGSQAQSPQEARVEIEQAPTVSGPWTKVPVNAAFVGPDGSFITSMADKEGFFRLQIEAAGDGSVLPVLSRAALPPVLISRATGHLQDLLNLGAETNPPVEVSDWQGVELGEFVIPIYDLAHKEGKEPAGYEFKVVKRPREPRPIPFLGDVEVEEPEAGRGYLLMSVNEEDAPLPSFRTRGPTPGEMLLSRAGALKGLKILRFGPTFYTLENEKGELLANYGTQPYKPPRELLQVVNETISGDFNSDTGQVDPPNGHATPEKLPPPETYRNYEEFKADYLTNPVYQELRRRRALRAKTEWQILKGERVDPPVQIVVRLGQTTNVFVGQPIERWVLDSDEEGTQIARIAEPREGGLSITGTRAGAEDLIVQVERGRAEKYLLRVLPAAGGGIQPLAFTPGWQKAKVWVAGGYDEQPRYYQLKSSSWCDAVGCGPVAWAILLAWWDRHNVPTAFYYDTAHNTLVESMRTSDAPFKIQTGDYDGYALVRGKLDELHDACDVICDPFSDAGATPPGDMVEALYPVTSIGRGWVGSVQLPEQFRYMGMSYGWAWDLMDPDWNEPSNRIRTSVKAGRPAIVGLGWLWHYGVAYAYLYQEYQVAPGVPMYKRRWFKVNEGWGKDHGEWYSGGDTFLGTNLKFWQRHLP